MAKTKRPPRVVKPKIRNADTMTEAAFWVYIRSFLRQKNRHWKPLRLAKLLSRRKYKGSNPHQRFEYQCNHCKQWFPEKEVNVDHIIPAGTLTCANDLPGFVERLFCEVQGLQILCFDCHNIKTQNEKHGNTSSD